MPPLFGAPQGPVPSEADPLLPPPMPSLWGPRPGAGGGDGGLPSSLPSGPGDAADDLPPIMPALYGVRGAGASGSPDVEDLPPVLAPQCPGPAFPTGGLLPPVPSDACPGPGAGGALPEGLLVDNDGTHAFFAPECCTGLPYDPYPVDVWAAGVTLYTWLFGQVGGGRGRGRGRGRGGGGGV